MDTFDLKVPFGYLGPLGTLLIHWKFRYLLDTLDPEFPDFGLILEIFMRKLRMFAFTPLFPFFFVMINTYYVISCVIFGLFLVQKFQKLSFDLTKKSTFRMSAWTFRYFLDTLEL